MEYLCLFFIHCLYITKGKGKMSHFERMLQCFLPEIQKELNQMESGLIHDLEEIRIYKNHNVQLFAGGNRIVLQKKINGTEINQILNHLMQFSYHAFEEDLAKGFITIEGGHRVGICGKAVLEGGKVILLREISSLNIRHAREFIGCSEKIMHHIFCEKQQLNSVLLVSPPGCGKTTLLRDIARAISEAGFKVSICDERSEIAGMHSGQSSYHLGPMTDVLDGCPKAEGMMMLIRSMSPDVIITDEIGKAEDFDAIKTCLNCGIHLITSVHGNSMEDLKRSTLCPVISSKAFQKIIFLTNKPTVGTIKEVIDV